jgi:superfamily II DNA or RNA helicase
MVVIVDEVHRAGAKKYRRIFSMSADARMGLSATPIRPWDVVGTREIENYFEKHVFEYTLSQAVREGYLVGYNYYLHPVPLNREELAEYGEVSTSIAKAVQVVYSKNPSLRSLTIPHLVSYLENLERPSRELLTLRELFLRRAKIVKAAKAKLAELIEITNSGSFRRCLVYFSDLSQLDIARRLLIGRGISAVEYSSRIHVKQRAEIRKRLALGHVHFVFSVKCLDEGIDIPACDSAIFVASSKSEREFIQRRGRVLRIQEGKGTAEIHDIVVLPFVDPRDAFALEKPEADLVRWELERARLFMRDARNATPEGARLDDLLDALGITLGNTDEQ